VFIRTTPPSKVADIQRFEDDSGTRSVTFSYVHALSANETAQMMLVMGLDVRKATTDYPPLSTDKQKTLL